MAYRAIFGVQVHADDQILVARLNRIREPLRVTLERRVQRRFCHPAFQGARLAIRVRGYEACLNSEVSNEDQRDQCENVPPKKLAIDFIASDVCPQQL